MSDDLEEARRIIGGTDGMLPNTLILGWSVVKANFPDVADDLIERFPWLATGDACIVFRRDEEPFPLVEP